jgi:hypothetical protein
VGDGVDGPDVAGVQRDRFAAGFLGGCVVAALLEPEREHAQDVAVARLLIVPSGQRARHRIAELARIAGVEVGEVAEPERDDVARMIGEDRFPAFGGAD